MELKGKTAIITGSTGQLGSQITLALAEAGCNCICHYYQNEKSVTELTKQIESLGLKAVAIQADLTCEKQVEVMFEKIRVEIDKGLSIPQILINSAAVFARQHLAQINSEDVQKTLFLNLTAPILLSRNFVKLLNEKASGEQSPIGKIINMLDVGAVRPWGEYAVYCSSKAGLLGATKALAKELAPAVCVNAIAPGVTTWPDDYSQAEKDRQLSFIPMRRIAGTNEITPAIIFLLESDYITGQVLCVDGGRGI